VRCSTAFFDGDERERRRRLGYIAANTGFGPGAILALTDVGVAFWTSCLSLHFEWVNKRT
jgi:dipeptidase